jgi:aspartyl/asparaginyl beta-hydroxylase (cupin superfamily)
MSKFASKAGIFQSGLCKISGNLGLRRPSPSIFVYPGLSSPSPLLPARLFPRITETLQSNFDVIKSEFLSINSGQNRTSNDYEESNEHHKLHNGEWNWNSYIKKGKRSGEFALKCPRTAEILESLPNLMTGTPFSYAFFSTLRKGATIDAHTGPCNLRIRCHFPLIVPTGDVGMQIGLYDASWKVGEPLFFDDTYLHRVWNRADGDRVVLLFDIWHPELEDDEISEIQAMFRENAGKDSKE